MIETASFTRSYAFVQKPSTIASKADSLLDDLFALVELSREDLIDTGRSIVWFPNTESSLNSVTLNMNVGNDRLKYDSDVGV